MKPLGSLKVLTPSAEVCGNFETNPHRTNWGEVIDNHRVYINGGYGKGGQIPLPVSVEVSQSQIKDVVLGAR